MRSGSRRLQALLMAVIFLGAGIFMIYLGIQNSMQQKSFYDTDGVITKIYRVDDNDKEYHYDVFVKYTVNGKEYESLLGEYKNNFREGMELALKYDPADPVNVISAGPGMSIYLIVFGSVGIIIALILALKALR